MSIRSFKPRSISTQKVDQLCSHRDISVFVRIILECSEVKLKLLRQAFWAHFDQNLSPSLPNSCPFLLPLSDSFPNPPKESVCEIAGSSESDTISESQSKRRRQYEQSHLFQTGRAFKNRSEQFGPLPTSPTIDEAASVSENGLQEGFDGMEKMVNEDMLEGCSRKLSFLADCSCRIRF
ncbi:hypothetical protein BLNAU_13290 [Blattamonas nauphoetae]|uniref:Uncharacterized protein n=1 Tax=Blattamonas nauphoetae TaxID=2049346 RepID=A0ABQ9XK75_9EUKA|nr:hypothetical protein BLNAU_13290 [Blattamonas nauphoetae]